VNGRIRLAVLAHAPAELERALAPLRERVDLAMGSSAEALGDELDVAVVLFAWGKPAEPFGHILRRAPRLRWVHSTGAGIEYLLVPELLERPITLTNSRGLYSDAIAEYVLALMLAHAKRLPELFRAQQARLWQPGLTATLAGATLVVLGLGSIGLAVARRARAGGMRVLAVRRRPTGRAVPRSVERVYATHELAAALPEAAYLAVCCPETPETRGLLDARALALLPPGAFVVNVARASIVDQAALVEALRAGRLGGAGLDVFADEPLPADSPLWELPGVIVSPHHAGNGAGWDTRALALFRDNLDRFLNGRRLRNVVDKRRGY
jgi:phosphoglycerate dehydrogenase-like enzyme